MKKRNIDNEEVYSEYQRLQEGQYILSFSVLEGNNYYKIPRDALERNDQEILSGIHVQSNIPVKIRNIKRNQKTVSDNSERLKWYRKIIWDIMPEEKYEWPIDVIEYGDPNNCTRAFVFPTKPYPKYIPLKELLYQEKTSAKLDWRNKEIQTIIMNLLDIFSELHKNKFYYNDFDMNKIFYHPESQQIFLRYTTNLRIWQGRIAKPGVVKVKEVEFGNPDLVKVEDLAVEFLPPYLNGKKFYTGNIDEYCITSLLFYLMIGRMPYEGKALTAFGEIFDPNRDIDESLHRDYFEHYHNYPVFIFDIENDSNSLGPMWKNDLPRERWSNLSDEVKEMFQKSLGNLAPERRSECRFYSLDDWMEALNKLWQR